MLPERRAELAQRVPPTPQDFTGQETETLVAHSLVGKFGDYLLFYRQADIYRHRAVLHAANEIAGF